MNYTYCVDLKSDWRVFFIVQVSLRSTEPESNAGAVAGGVVAVLIVLVVVGVLSVFYIR